MIALVAKFNEKFALPTGQTDVLSQDREALAYRIDFMEEELGEFALAMAEGDRVKAFDALLDLVYVAQGTALFLGINTLQWNEGMAVVHRANMAKVRVARADQSKRGSTFDVVKPEGWIPPEKRLEEILKCKA